MVLNQAKDIRIGMTEVDKVCCDGQIVWQRQAPPFMPHMDAVTNYYDCKKDLTIGSYWKNQYDCYGIYRDMPVSGQISIAEDGALTMFGTQAGYAWFMSETADGSTRTAYLIAKAEASPTHAQNPVLMGASYNSTSTYTASFAAHRDTNVLDLDMWGLNIESTISAADYHVMTWTRSGSLNSFYVDGVLVGTATNGSRYYYASGKSGGRDVHAWGVGCLFRRNAYDSWGDKVQRWIQFVAVADTAHTAAQVAANSAWLREYYGLTPVPGVFTDAEG